MRAEKLEPRQQAIYQFARIGLHSQAANKLTWEADGGFNPRISRAKSVGFSPGGLFQT